eukprot:1161268-Pelagomonas_calceolata.AAC.4
MCHPIASHTHTHTHTQDPEGRLVLSLQGTSEEYLDEEMRRVERSKDEHTADIIERVHVSGSVLNKTTVIECQARFYRSPDFKEQASFLWTKPACRRSLEE